MNLSLQYVNYMNCMVTPIVRVFGGGVVIWMSYVAQYVWFKSCVAMASMGATCAWQ